ncbi:tryptophan synthase subunit beta [Desulfovibrio sp. OttesenSCG-928-A18]|nr:tryptophan synthase subunit beta [Desulfovibrio sp. OttesenSCG-928-A18]
MKSTSAELLEKRTNLAENETAAPGPLSGLRRPAAEAGDGSAPAPLAAIPGSEPDEQGFFGPHGGCFVPPSLAPVLRELAVAYARYRHDPEFLTELQYYLKNYAGRQTPLYRCEKLSKELGGAAIYLKREDLNHLGAHKVNNTLGQILLARRMGKKRIIAETGAGSHGVAAAAVAALMGMECAVYMGEEDMKRQAPNVMRMRMMGARVVCVLEGQRTLKEAVDAAIAAWAEDPESFYLLGSAVGPHPYPLMVRDFQSVIGRETREQSLEEQGRLPDACIACVGGGSNSIGMFHPFIKEAQVRLIGVEPGGRGSNPGDHAATMTYGTPGVVHGFSSYLLQDEKGQVAPVYSISAGLDYPGVGPEHALLKDAGRAEYVVASDAEAVEAFFRLSRSEGIIPALESSHALAHALKLAPTMRRDQFIVVCLSGRGDKDLAEMEAYMPCA